MSVVPVSLKKKKKTARSRSLPPSPHGTSSLCAPIDTPPRRQRRYQERSVQARTDQRQSVFCFFFSSRRRHTRYWRDWSSDVCSSDLRAEKMLRAIILSWAWEVP